MSDTSHNAADHARSYLMVFGALAVLTVVTVAVGYMSLPLGLGITVALIIASIKGSMVAAYFMHLLNEQKGIYWLLMLTGFFLMFMFIIFASFAADGESRRIIHHETNTEATH